MASQKPTVTTNATDQITDTTARANGEVTDDGGATVTERGFVYSTSPNPTKSDTLRIVSGTTGSYSVTIDNVGIGLEPNTTYYIRAYAENSEGITYGDDDEFTTEATPTLPSVTTQAASGVGSSSATLNGTVTDDGNATITRRGFVLSTSTIADPGDTDPDTLGVTVVDESGSFGEGAFDLQASGLDAETQYYVRAFAENELGLVYGSEQSFITVSVSFPGVTSVENDVANLTSLTNKVANNNGIINKTANPTNLNNV